MISKEEYNRLANDGFNIIPLIKDLNIELDSPISLYSSIKDKKNTFLLESIEGGQEWAQYSIIGLNCKDSIKISGNEILIDENGSNKSYVSDSPLEEINRIIKTYKPFEPEELPRFYGGYVGFFAYESSQYAEEKIKALSKKESKFKEHMPDVYLVKADQLIVYDNFNNSISAIFNADPNNISYEDALEQLSMIETSLGEVNISGEIDFKEIKETIQFESNFKKEDFISSVEKIKTYIKEGDVMQVVLAQDFFKTFDGNSFELYAALRKLNPSPYMYYLNLDECHVVGASPEILVRLEKDEITLRPIAGTRKRGKNEQEDKINEQDLLNDPKELAEHLMLIDLGRNDVGRVADIGTVKVTEKMIIERYSHVMHIVSNVVGKLSSELSFIDALKATLPAGTLSGAPKIRAMEIINELEPSSRGIYGGAIGYISWNGNIDTAIAIRTAVIKDNLIHVGAGAGIVADSNPESEWEECLQKSRVFLDAMEMIS